MLNALMLDLLIPSGGLKVETLRPFPSKILGLLDLQQKCPAT
jgi:hypothetical protein